MAIYYYPVEPMGAVRQNEADKWRGREAVRRYNDFKAQCRDMGVIVPPDGSTITFFITMPKSWSKKKKARMEDQYHRQTPDVDNICKGILDSVLVKCDKTGEMKQFRDEVIADIRIVKRWAIEGCIVIETPENDQK